MKILPLFLLIVLSLSLSFSWSEANSGMETKIRRDFIEMPDKTRLSVTYFLPGTFRDSVEAKKERYPILLELLPYRKDDQFFLQDYSFFSHFTKSGYVVAKVDVRGTGTSQGVIPDREYSETELSDAVFLIDHLSKLKWSNGNVGMMGISWGGFNAIQVAMRNPPALKAILVGDATDDLYRDDVHFIDGIFHADEYALTIENDLSVAAWPDYRLDEAYFQDRFYQKPWVFTYKRQQRDGFFWRKNSLRWQYESLKIPVFMIGGLFDGYRDSVPRMLKNLSVPMKAIMGPWNHAWPHDGDPGPNFEWRGMAIRWWDHWLKNIDTGILNEPPLLVFIRDGHGPGTDLTTLAGEWIQTEWPVKETTWKRFYPTLLSGKRLLTEVPSSKVGRIDLPYISGTGTSAGYWWGELSPDMQSDDESAIYFDSLPLQETLRWAGNPRLKWSATASSPLVHWVVRLEDVSPSGEVTLVTGAALNGAQRNSRLFPEFLTPGIKEYYDLELHFSTWTFKEGHRVRLVLSHSQFPMFWPTPFANHSTVFLYPFSTYLEIPENLFTSPVVSQLPEVATSPEYPNGGELDSRGWPYLYEVKKDIKTKQVKVDWKAENAFWIDDKKYRIFEETRHSTKQKKPWDASFKGLAGYDVKLPDNRFLEFRTEMNIRSNARFFKINFIRKVSENGKLIRKKRWVEKIPRIFQ